MSKKIGVIVILIVLLTMSYASAMSTNSMSELEMTQVLNGYGIVQGDGGNFHLDDSLSREEAIVLLIRMLNKEEDASIYSLSSSFNDVPENHWARNYIAYAGTAAFTDGIAPGVFGLGQEATEQAVYAYMLRAMGYDVPWEDIFSKADQVGIKIDNPARDGSIKRGKVFEIIYKTLNQNDKNGKKMAARFGTDKVPTSNSNQIITTKERVLSDISWTRIGDRNKIFTLLVPNDGQTSYSQNGDGFSYENDYVKITYWYKDVINPEYDYSYEVRRDSSTRILDSRIDNESLDNILVDHFSFGESKLYGYRDGLQVYMVVDMVGVEKDNLLLQKELFNEILKSMNYEDPNGFYKRSENTISQELNTNSGNIDAYWMNINNGVSRARVFYYKEHYYVGEFRINSYVTDVYDKDFKEVIKTYWHALPAAVVGEHMVFLDYAAANTKDLEGYFYNNVEVKSSGITYISETNQFTRKSLLNRDNAYNLYPTETGVVFNTDGYDVTYIDIETKAVKVFKNKGLIDFVSHDFIYTVDRNGLYVYKFDGSSFDLVEKNTFFTLENLNCVQNLDNKWYRTLKNGIYVQKEGSAQLSKLRGNLYDDDGNRMIENGMSVIDGKLYTKASKDTDFGMPETLLIEVDVDGGKSKIAGTTAGNEIDPFTVVNGKMFDFASGNGGLFPDLFIDAFAFKNGASVTHVLPRKTEQIGHVTFDVAKSYKVKENYMMNYDDSFGRRLIDSKSYNNIQEASPVFITALHYSVGEMNNYYDSLKSSVKGSATGKEYLEIYRKGADRVAIVRGMHSFNKYSETMYIAKGNELVEIGVDFEIFNPMLDPIVSIVVMDSIKVTN